MERRAHDGVDHPTVAGHEDRCARVATEDPMEGDTDAMLELGERLATTRERDPVGITLPVRHAVPLDELVEAQPITLGAGIMLAEARLDLDRTAEHPPQCLGGLHRPGVGARVEGVDGELTGAGQTLGEGADLPLAELGQSTAGARSADHPTGGHHGLAVAHEHQSARIGRLTWMCHAARLRPVRSADISSSASGRHPTCPVGSCPVNATTPQTPPSTPITSTPATTTRSGMVARLTITSLEDDPRALAIERAAADLGLTLGGTVEIADIVFVEGDLDEIHRTALERLLVDPLLQHGTWQPEAPEGAVEITFLPGVTDTAAAAVLTAADRLGLPVTGAATGRRICLVNDIPDRTTPDPASQDRTMELLIRRVIANPVIERWGPAPVPSPIVHPPAGHPPVEVIEVRGADDAALEQIGIERSLALDPEELVAIREHFTAEGRDPTDVELETLAQTWSEHCAHKTFRAELIIDDIGEHEDGGGHDRGEDDEGGVRGRTSLLGALRRCTEQIGARYVRSAFVGNAGIVSFHPGITLAIKAETHNHPSAVEPFGGANTGVGGVIRDVLGASHRPIAVTDVLCFGPPDVALGEVPEGALHPRRIREGVIDGVADYGNKIGLPTVAGAVLYDPGYTTNPLVFAGCLGMAPERPLPVGPHAGDRVVVLGGRTGRDGIRGATFSSLTMDATTGEVAGASVQIGDPITEKLLIDVLIGAEDLYSAITDCGAGGLSSAVGEMAEGVGAEVELDRVPLKYAGLAAWEIWLSEAQERMVIAVPPDRLPALVERCTAAGVELADLGKFTGTGRLVVRHHGEVVLDLDTEFLHEGRPRRRMRAVLPRPDRTPVGRMVERPGATLLALLAHRNIASKAATIHRYDHEIRGATVVRPMVGPDGDGPGDGVVLAEPTDTHGVALGIGVNPWYGLHDPDSMARTAVDEAIRNVVAVGADPDQVALLDNFSWGDPRRETTLGELIAAVDGCCAAALAHRAPFVSGKDSLNNEYTGADGRRHAVPPTLVIHALAHHPDVSRAITSDLVHPGDLLVLIGRTGPDFAGSHLDLVLAEAGVAAPEPPGRVPRPDSATPQRYRAVHRAIHAGHVVACHDPSEGGLAVALAEMCIGGGLGARLSDLGHPDLATAMFAESAGRFVVEVPPDRLGPLSELLPEPPLVLGEVTAQPVLDLAGVATLHLEQLATAFRRHAPVDPYERQVRS